MRKLNLLMIGASIMILSSCEKDKNKPLDTIKNSTTEAFDYTERNSTTISWNQLSDELKNAEQLTTNSNEHAKITASYQISLGPWGGTGGSAFSIYPTANTDKIYAIAMRSGVYVDALTIWYKRTNGTIYSYNKGGTGGAFYIQYFASNEYIRYMGGKSGIFIDRLSIYTNLKSFSYGGDGGGSFFVSAGNNQILGFFGHSGIYIDQIGGYAYTL
ncbi:MAG: jacalin-like lectin [Bacteroidia bacterium]